MSINTISKQQFEIIYNRHLPNAWTKFIFKYFSKSTEKKNLVVSSTIAWVLGALFLVGFGATVTNLPKLGIIIVTLTYAAILSTLVFGMFAALIMNNIRIKKIAKELGISVVDYNELVDKFYS